MTAERDRLDGDGPPTADLGRRPSARRRHAADVRRILRPHRWRIAAMAASSFAAGGAETALLVVITRVGLAVAENDQEFGVLAGRSMAVSTAIGFAAALVALRLALALVSMWLTVTLTARVGTTTRRELADAYLHATWATQQQEPAGRLQELLVSYAGSTARIAMAFGAALNALLSLTALVIGSLLINPGATFFVLVALVLLATMLAPLRRRIRSRARRAADAQMVFASSVSELGGLGLEMQAFGVRDRFVGRVGDLIDEHQRLRSTAEVARGLLTPVYTALAFSALVGGLAIASVVGPGELGGAAAVTLVMLRALSYGQALQTASGNLASLAPYLETIEKMTSRYREEPAELGIHRVAEVGRIRARSVSFTYEGREEVLRDVSFTIARGEMIGVVGPSGAGKSSLAQLLLGLRRPTSGSILVDDVDLRHVERTSWGARTAFVSQEANLLTGTVAENIRFFRDGIDDERIEQAAADANILSEIRAMPSGFDSVIGERGVALSGGQRQRLSIARALAGEPELIILDEPTSALDGRSESLIRDTLKRLHGRVTVLVIAHRLSTLDDCDRIMVIENGELVAMGARSELLRDSDFFRHSIDVSGRRT